MLIATELLSETGRIAIPRAVLERLDLKSGDDVRFVETSQGIVIEKQQVATADAPGGPVPDLGVETDDWLRMRIVG